VSWLALTAVLYEGHIEMIGLVSDVYQWTSIKVAKQLNDWTEVQTRLSGTRTYRRHNVQQGRKFLCSPSNKDQFRHVSSGRVHIFTIPRDSVWQGVVHDLSWNLSRVEKIRASAEVAELQYTHKEADTCLLMNASNACGLKGVIIISEDDDVMMLCLNDLHKENSYPSTRSVWHRTAHSDNVVIQIVVLW